MTSAGFICNIAARNRPPRPVPSEPSRASLAIEALGDWTAPLIVTLIMLAGGMRPNEN